MENIFICCIKSCVLFLYALQALWRRLDIAVYNMAILDCLCKIDTQ